MEEAVCTVEYLQYKWGLYFYIVDINGDNVLDTTDVELSKAHYRRHNNLSTKEVNTLNIFGDNVTPYNRVEHSTRIRHIRNGQR